MLERTGKRWKFQFQAIFLLFWRLVLIHLCVVLQTQWYERGCPSMSCPRLSQMLDVQPQVESEASLNEAEDKLKQMRQDCLKWIALPEDIFEKWNYFQTSLVALWILVPKFALGSRQRWVTQCQWCHCRMMKAIWAEDERSRDQIISWEEKGSPKYCSSSLPRT